MFSKLSKNFVLVTLLAIITLSPALTFAKNDGENGKKQDKQEQRKDKEDDKNEKKDKLSKNENACFKAFGHLIARGFIKNKGEVTLPGNCWLPFGIAKKFRGFATSTATTTVDTIAPVISNLSTNPNTIKATVSWKTNEKSDSTVFFSTSPNVNVNASGTSSITKNGLVKDHNVTIEGLTASTTYYVVVRSKDASGNTSLSSEISFKTKALALDTNPPTVSGIALLTGTSTINVGWSTNENATSKVYYNTSGTLDVNASSTAFLENTTLTQTHTITLTGLATSTQYFLVVESRDASGNRTLTPTFNTTTSSGM